MSMNSTIKSGSKGASPNKDLASNKIGGATDAAFEKMKGYNVFNKKALRLEAMQQQKNRGLGLSCQNPKLQRVS